MGEYIPKFNGTYVGKNKYITNEEVCRILSDVVKIDSTFGREGDCGRLLEKIAKENGLTVEIMPVCADRFNVMITVGADSYKSRKLGFMLHGHYDTVPMLDMPDPLNTKITDNKMWGRGIVDQKCGLVASLCAAIAVKRCGRPLKKPLCVAAVVDEESEHRGSYALVRSGVNSEYALVTEPTNTTACEFGCKGTTPIRIKVAGRTAHASNPWIGVNAIQKSMPILEGLFNMTFPEVDLGGDLGRLRGTLCVSKIDAGTAYNNVPGEAVIWMDRRTVPGENTPLALSQVNAIIAEAKKRDPELKAFAEVARPDWHWEPIRERGLNPTLMKLDCELYKILDRAASKTALKLEKRYSNGYNEMDFLINDLGIETLVYGPGDGRMAHSPKEEVDIDEVCNVAEVYCNVIEEICM
jgi:acetylornithine deacetylase/succinyl-diaminopimelate desuccinylase-like protein